MPGYQRALVMTGIVAILVAVLAGSTLALPVHGNLDITSGQARIGRGAFGDDVSATVAGPGFDLSFLACAETFCLRSTPGNPGGVIAPGKVFMPTVFRPDPTYLGLQFYDGGTATLLGVRYSGSGTSALGPNSILVLAGAAPLIFDATFASPSFLPLPGPLQFVTLSAPFRFSGELILGVAGEFPDTFFDLHLSGQGQASITLFGGGPNGAICFEGLCGWGIGGSVFDFAPAPVPEPTTLLLWGTGAAGLGVVRWISRRRAA